MDRQRLHSWRPTSPAPCSQFTDMATRNKLALTQSHQGTQSWCLTQARTETRQILFLIFLGSCLCHLSPCIVFTFNSGGIDGLRAALSGSGEALFRWREFSVNLDLKEAGGYWLYYKVGPLEEKDKSFRSAESYIMVWLYWPQLRQVEPRPQKTNPNWGKENLNPASPLPPQKISSL